MKYSQFKQQRLAELMAEQWGDIRIPDLIEVFSAAKPRRVLEIGCFRGVSTEFWALHCAKVVAIDPWDLTGKLGMDGVWREFQSRLVHYPHVDIYKGYSIGTEIELQAFDLVYLDGDHSYDTVSKEIDRFLPWIADGGFIGGHDYTETPIYGDGVKQAVDDAFGVINVTTFSDGSWLVRKP